MNKILRRFFDLILVVGNIYILDCIFYAICRVISNKYWSYEMPNSILYVFPKCITLGVTYSSCFFAALFFLFIIEAGEEKLKRLGPLWRFVSICLMMTGYLVFGVFFSYFLILSKIKSLQYGVKIALVCLFLAFVWLLYWLGSASKPKWMSWKWFNSLDEAGYINLLAVICGFASLGVPILWCMNHYWLPSIFAFKSIIFNFLFLSFGVLSLLWCNNHRFLRNLERVRKYLCVFVIVFAAGFLLLTVILKNRIQNITISRPNVVLISIDTLRADHLGCYGYGRNTSSNIDRFASKSILYKNCMSTSSWTLPAHASMLTGLYPSSHCVINDEFQLDDKYLTLAEILREYGYETTGFVSGWYLDSQFNLYQGFDLYDESYMSNVADSYADELTHGVQKWLRDRKEKPFFLFLHYFDVHNNYVPPEPFGKAFRNKQDSGVNGDIVPYLSKINLEIDKNLLDGLKDLYDGEVEWVDYNIGKFLDTLEELQLDKKTLIILTSDHGDEFLEHGHLGHRRNLYQTTMHVPLIIKLPGKNSKEINETLVSPIDIMPTILAFLRVDIKYKFDGTNILEDKEVDSERYIFGELYRSKLDPGLRCIRNSRYKLIFDMQSQKQEVFDLEKDAVEKENLLNREDLVENEEILELKEKFFEFLRGRTKAESHNSSMRVNTEKRKELKSLGYLQ